MRTSKLMSGAVAAFWLLGTGWAMAQAGGGQQSTGTQTEFRHSVHAKKPTAKRHHIIRAEQSKNRPNVGMAPR
jgi:hypothetical protein